MSVAVPLMMPMTSAPRFGNLLKKTMSVNKITVDSENTHIETIRSNYETDDLGAIMARFYEAVSWGDD
jgi:hypothetical protein